LALLSLPLPLSLSLGHQIFSACGAAPISGCPAAQKAESRASRSGTAPSPPPSRGVVVIWSSALAPAWLCSLSLPLPLSSSSATKFLGLRRSTHFGLACGAEGRKQSKRIGGWSSALAPAWLCSLSSPSSDLALLSLVSLEKNPAYGGEPKRPRIWSFLAELFRMAFFFFSESRCLSKCCVLANLIGKPPSWTW